MEPHRESIGRRTFLKATAAAAGLSMSACGPRRRDTKLPPMRYRHLGGTGLSVSEITFGAHGVDNGALMRAAFDAGINTFFTSGEYLDGREEESVGEIMQDIGGARDRFVVITGNELRPGDTKERIGRSIDASLRRLRTDHIDVYCAFQVSTPAGLRVDALFEAFEEARRAGKTGHLGLSGHCGGMQACMNAAMDDGRFEVFCVKYDFVSYPDQAEIFRRAAGTGIGTVVFKTNAGNRSREIHDLEAEGLSFRQAAVRWALGNPDVSSVAVTITAFDQIGEYASATGSALTGSEVDMLRRYRDEMEDRYCRFCARCEAACPRPVAIADVMRYAMYFQYYGREDEAARLYRNLPRRRSAAGCAGCPGPCEALCPFGRRVREGLVRAHQLLAAGHGA